MADKSSSINVNDVKILLEKITEGATSDKIPLSELLRLCMRLGKLLHNDELMTWAIAELNGYKTKEELPEYRILPTQVSGHFSGSFGSGIRNAHIPQMVIDKDHRDNLFTNYIFDPVAELEQLTKGDKSETLHSYWSADVIAYYQQKEIYQGMVLSSAWRILTKAALTGILDTIRTRILEFSLRIEQELNLDELDTEKEKDIEVKPSTVSQVFNNTIYGGNVSMANTGNTTQQMIQIQKGDIAGLHDYLGKLGVTKPLLEELDEALEADATSENKPGPKTTNWISRIMILIGKGSLALATNAAGSLIASAIMKYLGVSS